MIHETIERFRYRFELWLREQRENLSGEPFCALHCNTNSR